MSGRWAAAPPVPSLLQVLLALQCGVVFLQCSAASAMSGDGECCLLPLFRSSFSTGNFVLCSLNLRAPRSLLFCEIYASVPFLFFFLFSLLISNGLFRFRARLIVSLAAD